MSGIAEEIAPEEPGAPIAATPLPATAGGTGPLRKIIKDGQIVIEASSIDLAVSRLTSDAVAVGGYVVETRTDFSAWQSPSAVVRMAVPVDRFEEALERIRAVGERVVSESATGTDVTQEYVDLQSQIANLEATQARIREFLDDAQNVEEALRVNAQLSEIEGQIAQLKGRLQYLGQRSAFSTIAVEVHQSPSAQTPTPTPTPVPPPPFDPGETADSALRTLRAIAQAALVVAIWLVIVGVPLALPIVALAAIVRRVRANKGTGA
jgi:hypothetical protein